MGKLDKLLNRQKDIKVGKASKFQQREAKGSIKKRVRNMCSDVAVIPEVLVNPNKRSPLREKDDKAGKAPKFVQREAKDSLKKRKEEISQTEVDNSVKHIKVNPPKREYGGKAGKDPKSQKRESNDSLKKRKEESPQTEVDNSVKRIKVNPPKRENVGKEGKAPKSQQRESNDSLKKSDVAVVNEAIGNSYKRSPLRFSDKMNITKEESPQSEIDDFVKSIKMNPSKRKTTATYTPLDGSRHDTFETKMSNSSQMEPLPREGNSPDSCCHHQCHYQQQLTEHLEYEHDHPPPPHSFHVPNKDTTDRIFMLLCAILGVGLVHMLLLGYKFTH